MMKELTLNEMEMIYGGAELKAETKSNSEFSIGDSVIWAAFSGYGTGLVVWPGDESTTVVFPEFGIIESIPNEQLIKIG